MTTLTDELHLLIASEGPISVERYMALALGHPGHGYYMTRDPLGAAGDFTTAPEISQMFGELLGLWAATVWSSMGGPHPVRLVELGPGRGTLMADAVRAAAALPSFRAALEIHLVETSPSLREAQRRHLAAHGLDATWHDAIETVPRGPAVILANEFFDALPIRQFIRTPRGVFERLVGLDAEGRLAFGLSPDPVRPAGGAAEGAPDLLPFEVRLAGERIVELVGERLCQDGGALLVVDYGHARSGLGDTLQAVSRHRPVHPLATPGKADLTAHVDFAALAVAATRAGAAVHGPVGQGDFLRALGLEARAARLRRTASQAQAADIAAAVERLAGPAPGMGELFKVMAVTHPALPTLPGLNPELPA